MTDPLIACEGASPELRAAEPLERPSTVLARLAREAQERKAARQAELAALTPEQRQKRWMEGFRDPHTRAQRALAKGLLYVLQGARIERARLEGAPPGAYTPSAEALISLVMAYIEHEDGDWRERLQIDAEDRPTVWDLLDRWAATAEDTDLYTGDMLAALWLHEKAQPMDLGPLLPAAAPGEQEQAHHQADAGQE